MLEVIFYGLFQLLSSSLTKLAVTLRLCFADDFSSCRAQALTCVHAPWNPSYPHELSFRDPYAPSSYVCYPVFHELLANPSLGVKKLHC